MWEAMVLVYKNMKRKYDTLPSGSGYPDDIDFGLLQKFAFLQPFLEDRPVFSTISFPDTSNSNKTSNISTINNVSKPSTSNTSTINNASKPKNSKTPKKKYYVFKKDN